MKNSQKGFVVPLLIVIVVLMVGGGVYLYKNGNVSNQTDNNNTQTSDNQIYIIRDSSEVIDPLYKDWTRMNSLSKNPAKPGDKVTINGANFSLEQKNFIKLLGGDRALLEVYVASTNGNTVTFTIPRNAPAGTYMLSVMGEAGYDVFRDFRIISK